MPEKKNILVYGYGNPGRQDDALGNACVEELEKWSRGEGLTHLAFDSNYQLNIEDADNIAGYDWVVFIDASQEDIDDFLLTRVQPSAKVEFSMHAVTPAFVLNLCKSLFDEVPEVCLLHVKGYEWELREELTPGASRNLRKAVEFLKPLLLNPEKLRDSIL